MSKVTNTAELNAMLSNTLQDVLDDKIHTTKVKNIVSVVDKLNRSNANQLKYKALTHNNKKIPFFEC